LLFAFEIFSNDLTKNEKKKKNEEDASMMTIQKKFQIEKKVQIIRKEKQ